MKNSLIFVLAITLISFSPASFAQTEKIITLQDGSVLKGEVIQLSDGIYTLETSTLGRMTIPESDILSITSAAIDTPQDQGANSSDLTRKEQIKSQVQAIQGNILSDPQLMTELQNVVSDAEVQKMLSDPKLLDDVRTYDPEKIQNNDSVQDLIQNPKVQDLMNKIQQKMPPQE
jgi:hypothetical protein